MTTRSILGVLLTIAGLCSCKEESMNDLDGHGDLDEALVQIDIATNQMANGDSKLWQQLYSHADDATLFGGWGGPGEKGWDQLSARWQMVTGRYRSGKMVVEPIAKHLSGDMAVTVQIVRGEATFADGSAGNVGLRVTHVLRRESGGWRIVHRHADEQMKLQPIASHIQR
jgi:ketosteroid isomerase-like protein